MEDWLKCQISPLVKYRQNQTKTKLQTNKIFSLILDENNNLLNIAKISLTILQNFCFPSVSWFMIHFIKMFAECLKSDVATVRVIFTSGLRNVKLIKFNALYLFQTQKVCIWDCSFYWLLYIYTTTTNIVLGSYCPIVSLAQLLL